MSKRVTCGECAHASPFDKYGGAFCRRYPPTVLWQPRDSHVGDFATVFPYVSSDEECGEGKLRPESGT